MKNNTIEEKTIFFLNGSKYITKQLISITDLLTYFNYKPELLVIELNGSICQKHKWLNTYIKNQDKIETVTIVGGG